MLLVVLEFVLHYRMVLVVVTVLFCTIGWCLWWWHSCSALYDDVCGSDIVVLHYTNDVCGGDRVVLHYRMMLMVVTDLLCIEGWWWWWWQSCSALYDDVGGGSALKDDVGGADRELMTVSLLAIHRLQCARGRLWWSALSASVCLCVCLCGKKKSEKNIKAMSKAFNW